MFWQKKIIQPIVLIAALISAVVLSSPAFSATSSTSVGVQMTVPAQNSGGLPPDGPAPDQPLDQPPIISHVGISPLTNSAQINWLVSDDKGVSTVTLVYGPTNSYGNSANVSGNYQATLSSLTINTIYYYKISATDTGGNTSIYASSFQTAATDDTTPPIISNVQAQASATDAIITFQTDEPATGQVKYGLTTGYGKEAQGSAGLTNHSVSLANLLPNTTYHYQVVATDAALNSSNTADKTFTTSGDNTPPPDVSGLQVNVSGNNLVITWSNPSLLATPDFSGVKVLRKVNAPASGISDPAATAKYTGSAESLTDDNVVSNIMYYYSVFSFDTSGNYSPGVSRGNKITPPPAIEVCGNGLDDDENGQADCADDACKNLESCKQAQAEVCNNGLDDDIDGKIDCLDANCSNDSACQPVPVEDCDNMVDDDKDRLADCFDSDCSGSAWCANPIAGGAEVCNDNIDNDSDQNIDCADSDCSGIVACAKEQAPVEKYEPKSSTVPEFAKLQLSDLIFLAGNKQIVLSPANGTVTGLSGVGLSVGVPGKVLVGVPKTMDLKIGGGSHQLALSSDNVYYAEIAFPAVGTHQAHLEIDYGAGQIDSVSFNLNSLPLGMATADDDYLPQAEVALYQGAVLVDTSKFGLPNPQFTTVNGLFGWMVPAGKYYITIKKPGFYDYKSPALTISNNVINGSFSVVKMPPKLAEVIEADASLGANILNVTKNLVAKTGALAKLSKQGAIDTAKVAKETADNPEVEAAARRTAPAVVGVSAVGTMALVSWLDIVLWLRFAFLQPLLFLGRGKRENWGVVYNSLSKLPADLAMVRLIDVDANKVVKSRVTDQQGRYAFVVDPGRYRLEVRKMDLVFPSLLLKEWKDDGRRLDIYHGEPIVVTSAGSLITANIPLDPQGEHQTPARLIWGRRLKRAQTAISWAGLVVTVVALYITPVWYMWLLAIGHILLFAIFKRLSRPLPTKGWGIVYDAQNRHPIARAVARLFDSQFNKLVATEVTDRQGRYYFLAGDSRYYVTYEHDQYQPTQTEVIDLQGKEADTITPDVGLQKK